MRKKQTWSAERWKQYNLNTGHMGREANNFLTFETEAGNVKRSWWDEEMWLQLYFAMRAICLDRIRTRRYFSVSPMSVDEGCSNKSLSRFLKDTVTKEMTGSRSSIIYPHRPSSAIPLLFSAAYITSIHAHPHTYDNHTPSRSAELGWG